MDLLKEYESSSSSRSYSPDINESELVLKVVKSEDINECNSEAIDDVPTTSTQSVADKTSQKKRINQRYENKIKRNSGQPYKTKSGKIIKARRITRLQKCKQDCQSKVTFEDQSKIFNSYWAQASREKRIDFVSTCVKLKDKKRSRSRNNQKNRRFTVEYHLPTENGDIIVCKKCFLHTLGETESFIKYLVSKSWSNDSDIVKKDGRGGRTPKNKSSPEKVKEIEDHIATFATYESHCTGKHAGLIYLAAGLNVQMMYRLYAEKVDQPLSLKIYRKVFNSTNLKFKSPLEKCDECDELHFEEKTVVHPYEESKTLSEIAECYIEEYLS